MAAAADKRRTSDQAGLRHHRYAGRFVSRKNPMPGLRPLSLTLACALALCLPAAAIAKTKSGTAKPERSATQALLAFQRDLVSVLAPRADAQPLLGAALLARPLSGQPKYNDFHTLIERAVAAPGNGAAESWMRLADCDAAAGTCPNADALAVLLTQAPDNAAVWLLQLGQDARDGKSDQTRQDLAKAASAKLYDDYTGTSLQALARNVSVLPPPPAVLDKDPAASAAGVQATLVFGIAGTQPQPGMPATASLCADSGDDAALKDDCLKLGKILEWGSSPLARSLGLHLSETLADDPAQQDAAKRARRDLTWQVQQFAGLSSRARTDAALAHHLLALARNGGTEMSLLLSALRDAGVPAQAPADWKSHAAE
jgi:hypothetical protein